MYSSQFKMLYNHIYVLPKEMIIIIMFYGFPCETKDAHSQDGFLIFIFLVHDTSRHDDDHTILIIIDYFHIIIILMRRTIYKNKNSISFFLLNFRRLRVTMWTQNIRITHCMCRYIYIYIYVYAYIKLNDNWIR